MYSLSPLFPPKEFIPRSQRFSTCIAQFKAKSLLSFLHARPTLPRESLHQPQRNSPYIYIYIESGWREEDELSRFFPHRGSSRIKRDFPTRGKFITEKGGGGGRSSDRFWPPFDSTLPSPVRSKRLSFYHPKRRGRECRLCTTFTRNVVCQQSPSPLCRENVIPSYVVELFRV